MLDRNSVGAVQVIVRRGGCECCCFVLKRLRSFRPVVVEEVVQCNYFGGDVNWIFVDLLLVKAANTHAHA